MAVLRQYIMFMISNNHESETSLVKLTLFTAYGKREFVPNNQVFP